MEERYDFEDLTYVRLGLAGVDVRDVLFVLHDSRPRWFRHIGAILSIAARDRADRWLGVYLYEIQDNHYAVKTARYLDEDEVESIIKMLKGQL